MPQTQHLTRPRRSIRSPIQLILLLLAMLVPALGSAQTVKTLALNPTTVYAGYPSTGTVTLSAAAPTGGLVVTLASNSSSATVGANVTVPAGSTSATFTVATVQQGATQASATITASANSSSQTATLTINPIALTNFTVAPNPAAGGGTITGTLTISQAAPPSGFSVACTSNLTPGVTVPATVSVPSGQTTGTFAVTAQPVASRVSATLTASAFGASFSQLLNIDPPVPQSLTLTPSTLLGGASSAGTVTLSGAAPTGGVTVTLASDNAAASVPGKRP